MIYPRYVIAPAIRFYRLRFLTGMLWLLAGLSVAGSTNVAWFTRVWKTDDGLLNNNILAAVQGRDGYLWVVPSVGLMRFDGVNFSRFPLEDFTGPFDAHISTARCSRQGVLWIATYGGRVIGVNPDFSAVTLPTTALPPAPALMLAEDAEGSLWLGYPRVICRVKDGQVTRFGTRQGVPRGFFHSLINDGAGNIWLAAGNDIRIFRNGRFSQVASVKDVLCLAASHTNAIWIVAGAHLLTCTTNGVLRDCGFFQVLSKARRRALLEDHTGAVWIGTDGYGLFRYDKSGLEEVPASCPSILSLSEDGEGNIWASTDGGGLDRIAPSGVRLESDPAAGQIQSICEDTNGVMWGATRNGVLISRIQEEWEPVFTNAPFNGRVTCVAADRSGGIWVGTRGGTLLRLVGSRYATVRQRTVQGPIHTLLPAANGDLWIVGSQILQCLHGDALRTVRLPREVNRISAIAEDAGGHIWVGAKGVVMRSAGGGFVDESPRLPISERTVCCLYASPGGSLWISCGGLGLIRFRNGRVGEIGSEQGLYNDYISQIVADDRGWLWFASDHGVFKVREAELDRAVSEPGIRLRPIVYGRNEGLSSLEALFSTGAPFVFPRAIRTRDGRVWLLTHTGVVAAEPKLLPEYPAPSVRLTGVLMDGRTIASYGSVVPDHTVANLKTLKAPLRLPPGHRHLEFEYTAFHSSAPENIQFRYQLVGFDNGWIDAQTGRHAGYSRLAAGNYQFRAEACIGDGPWSKRPAILAFTVTPFFWQTWWFRLGVLFLFTSSVIAIVRYVSTRRWQARMLLLEQRATLDKERTRIARDLHDDLGCSLNKVALTLDMMQHGSGLSGPDNDRILHCSTLVREVALSVDEIVWAINPRNDTLRYMVDYISQFAAEFLQAADIACLMDLPDNIPDRTVSPEVRHNLLLVVKEALNNIIRHAHADEVRLRVTTENNQVVIKIADNGCGFEHRPDNASCDGLRNMRQRMEEIGGRFQLDSRPGAGTRVELLYSWRSKT